MTVLILNTFREKIYHKTFYIIMLIGMVLMLIITTGNGNLTINGQKVNGFSAMVPVALSIISFIACLLAIMTSIQTIPNEFDRKTSHLILTRGIKPWQYMFALTAGNILTSIFSMITLYISLMVFCIIHGKAGLLPVTFLSVLILSISPAFLSAAVSLLSINIPVFVTGIAGILIYVFGMLHGILDTLAGTTEGFAAALARLVLFVIPNFSAIQGQASSLLTGKPVDLQPLAGGLLLLYTVLSLTFITFRKEG